jgi:hypothetical protein
MNKSHDSQKTHEIKPKKGKTAYIVFGVIVLILLIIFISQFIFKSNPAPVTTTTTSYNGGTLGGQYDNLAKCLTEKGAIFYGTEWCPHCKAQKEMFGSSMQYIVFVDCDQQKTRCTQTGITGYPTWKIPGQKDLMGSQQLNTLASATGCQI